MSPSAAIAVFSNGMSHIPHLAEFLGAPVALRPTGDTPLQGVAGWGNKPSAEKAKKYAKKKGLPYYFLEEGFLCSLGPFDVKAPVLSLLVDRQAAYFEARRSSDLETLLSRCKVPATSLERAKTVRSRVIAGRLNKYGPGQMLDLGPKKRRRILVVDQIAGDASIEAGLANLQTFKAMAQYAATAFNDADIIVKEHPSAKGRKTGVLRKEWLPHAQWIERSVDSFHLLSQVDEVLVVTSQMGFDALLLGKKVTCFGAPFYSGWGLTSDRVPCSRRTRTLSVDELFFLSFIEYPHYVHPVTGLRCEVEDTLDHVERQLQYRVEAKNLFLVGFPRWKHATVRAYLGDVSQRGVFVPHVDRAKELGLGPGDAVVVWGHNVSPEDMAHARALGAIAHRMEDGFVRSVGLGSDLVVPCSLVLDSQGIYYDATGPSALETLLATQSLTDQQRGRAAKLLAFIQKWNLTKYNFKPNEHSAQRRIKELLRAAGSRPIVVIPGQVEADASLRYGTDGGIDFTQMLAHVRKLRPDAFIVFRPHPDVLKGNRAGAVHDYANLVDHVECQESTLTCLEIATEVHCLTSLVGFDALLRGCVVHTWGFPFYAGWGLTVDHAPMRERKATITLEELVWGALIEYPRYYDFASRSFTTPEITFANIVKERDSLDLPGTTRPGPAHQVGRWLGFAKGWVRSWI